MERLSVLSGLVFATGFMPYILAILKKKTKPAKVSWIIWASLDTITLAGMSAENTANSQILVAASGGWIIAALAMKYGLSGWSKFDKFCLAGTALSVILWQIFNSPLLGIITSLGVTFLGAVPTFISTWEDPSRENKLAWTIFWVGCIGMVIAIPHWTLADAAQPIAFFIIETAMMYLLYGRSKHLINLKRPTAT